MTAPSSSGTMRSCVGGMMNNSCTITATPKSHITVDLLKMADTAGERVLTHARHFPTCTRLRPIPRS